MSLPAYQVYQEAGQGWIGRIPQHWRLLPLFALANERRAKNTGMVEDNLLSLSFGRIVRKDISTSEGLLPESFETYQIVEKDDIVWRLTDLQNDKRSLRTGIVRERGIITSAYLATRPTGLDPDFLNYLLRAYDLTKVFYSLGSGLRQSMKWADVKWLPIVTPTKDEQRGIVSFLDRETAKIDALIEEQEKLISLLQEKRQAVISHAVTKGLDPDAQLKPSGIDWLGDIPAHWGLRRLKFDLESLTSGSRGWAEYYNDTGPLFLRIGNLTRNSLQIRLDDEQRVSPPEGGEGSRTATRAGDLLFSITAYLGSVAVVPEDFEPAYVSQHVALARLKPDDLKPAWVGFVTLSTVGQAYLATQGYGGTKIQLSLEDIANIPVPTPPPEEQASIIAFLNSEIEALEKLEDASVKCVTLLKERRASLISAAVTGKTDVRGLATQSDKHADEVAA